MVDMTDQVGFI